MTTYIFNVITLLVKLACLVIPREQTPQEQALLYSVSALKSGELHESAAFTERFARYKEQYAFPEESFNHQPPPECIAPAVILSPTGSLTGPDSPSII